MAHVIDWCGFAGAWLLTAGPVYQAAIDLADEEIERADMERALASAPPPPRVSWWWWLLPPVAYAVHRQRGRAWRRKLIGVLTTSELEQLMHFTETATAWLFVAGGAVLIAVKETWDLREAYDWPIAVYVALVVVLGVACVANTMLRVRRREAILARARR